MDHQAKVWSSCPGFMGRAGHDLGQVDQVPNLPHKNLTILPHPISFISWPSLSQEAGLYLSRTLDNFEQFRSNFSEVRCQTKLKKIIFALGIYKSAHHLHQNYAACMLFSAEHCGGMVHNNDFQTQPPHQTMARYGYMANLSRCPSCPTPLIYLFIYTEHRLDTS